MVVGVEVVIIKIVKIIVVVILVVIIIVVVVVIKILIIVVVVIKILVILVIRLPQELKDSAHMVIKILVILVRIVALLPSSRRRLRAGLLDLEGERVQGFSFGGPDSGFLVFY